MAPSQNYTYLSPLRHNAAALRGGESDYFRRKKRLLFEFFVFAAPDFEQDNRSLLAAR
jgi:hypothetical protein